jgi:hypothetical protein
LRLNDLFLKEVNLMVFVVTFLVDFFNSASQGQVGLFLSVELLFEIFTFDVLIVSFTNFLLESVVVLGKLFTFLSKLLEFEVINFGINGSRAHVFCNSDAFTVDFMDLFLGDLVNHAFGLMSEDSGYIATNFVSILGVDD